MSSINNFPEMFRDSNQLQLIAKFSLTLFEAKVIKSTTEFNSPTRFETAACFLVRLNSISVKLWPRAAKSFPQREKQIAARLLLRVIRLLRVSFRLLDVRRSYSRPFVFVKKCRVTESEFVSIEIPALTGDKERRLDQHREAERRNLFSEFNNCHHKQENSANLIIERQEEGLMAMSTSSIHFRHHQFSSTREIFVYSFVFINRKVPRKGFPS